MLELRESNVLGVYWEEGNVPKLKFPAPPPKYLWTLPMKKKELLECKHYKMRCSFCGNPTKQTRETGGSTFQQQDDGSFIRITVNACLTITLSTQATYIPWSFNWVMKAMRFHILFCIWQIPIFEYDEGLK